MQTALCTIAFNELAVEQVLDLARDKGLDGVEIWGKEPHLSETYDGARVARLQKAVEQRGLVVSAFGSYVNPLMEDFEAQSQAALDIAVGLGTPIVRIWSGGGASKDVTDDVYAQVVARLREWCPRAEERELTLAFEFHDNSITDNAHSIVKLIEDVACPALRTYYQPSRREGADDPYESAELVGPFVVNVHAQNWAPDQTGRSLIEEGEVDYGRVVQILKKHGFDGYLEIEFVNEDDKAAALAADASFLRRLTRAEV